MAKAIYSQAHYDKKQKKLAKKKGQQQVVPKLPATSFELRQPPTPEERSRLRKAQGRTAIRDQDLEGYQRREYRLQDGSVSYSEPRILPPRHDLRRTRAIETDPDLVQEPID